MLNGDCYCTNWEIMVHTTEVHGQYLNVTLEGSTGNYGGTMVKNIDTINTINTMNTMNTMNTLKIVPDDIEDIDDNVGNIFRINDNSRMDPYGDADAGTLIRKSTPTHTQSSDDNDNCDGYTMITVETHNNNIIKDIDEDEDEYHENGFSPTSHDTPIQSPHHESNNSTITQATSVTIGGNNKHTTGGGYSIGTKGSSIFDGNTMVRQNSTDPEEEDPFQGQTMYRAPSVDSPRGQQLLLSDMGDNDTVTSMGTTKPDRVSHQKQILHNFNHEVLL